MIDVIQNGNNPTYNALDVKYISFTLFLIITSTVMTGCFGNDSMDWPDRVDSECEFEFENLSCDIFTEELENPIWGLNSPNNQGYWMIDQSGIIIQFNESKNSTILDISDIISRCHFEQGLLGFEFAEDFSTNGMVLLSYIEKSQCDGDNKGNLILSYAFFDGEKIDTDSVTELTFVNQPYRNHNGGHLVSLGNGSYLWGIGDGGSHKDPHNNGQDVENVLGSIQLFSFNNGTLIEVDDDETPYLKTMHHGLRNPWRFDVNTSGDLWIADVGQNCWEEINLVNLYNDSNFGWSEKEGYNTFSDSSCETSNEESENYTDPIHVYSHTDGNCSVTGGFWIDTQPHQLANSYIFGDFCTGSIWVLKNQGDAWESNFLFTTGTMIASFAKGPSEEILILTWGGTVYSLSE